MRTSALVFTLLIASLTLTNTRARLHAAQTQSLGAIAAASRSSRPTEQQWIVSEVVAAIAGMAAPPGTLVQAVTVTPTTPAGNTTSFAVTTGATAPIHVPVIGHIWSPETFGPVADFFMRRQPPPDGPPLARLDNAARDALIEPTVKTLLDENDRLSALLDKNMHSPDAHEAAALLVGTFALREAAGWFDDVRPSLSRMAAHLAIARFLRATGQEGKDGILARAILTVLVGHQRDALTMIDASQRGATSDADRRWARALRLRITGDWRGTAPTASDSLLERLEHARAVRERLGMDAFLDYFDTLPKDDLTDWQRIAFFDGLSMEASTIFTPHNVPREAAESAEVWSRFHQGKPAKDAPLEDLNDLPQRSIRHLEGIKVLDWGMWAAHQQRHLAHALLAAAYHVDVSRADLIDAYEKTFGTLRLFPIVLRWVADTPADYQRAITLALPLVGTTPELVTQRAWTLLLQKPSYMARPAAFPLDASWFTPAVPAGTAFELSARSLRPGNPRPATQAESARWALDMPYDHWTLWGKEWLAVDGKPSAAAVRSALAPLFGYDTAALLKMVDYLDLPHSERLEVTMALCNLAPGECDRLGELLVLRNQEPQAATAYERWESKTRDRVEVSNGVTWLVRYHQRVGNVSRAEAIARRAAEVESIRGLQELGEFLDRAGRYPEAERIYRQIVERYDDATVPLGTFLMRQSQRTSNRELQTEASEFLRPLFPGGLEPFARHNLAAVPSDGVTFASFGQRPQVLGMQFSDIIVAVDGWRVRNTAQYLAVTRFQHDDMMKLTIWRDGRYQDLGVRVPERSFGTRFKDHRGAPPAPSSAVKR